MLMQVKYLSYSIGKYNLLYYIVLGVMQSCL